MKWKRRKQKKIKIISRKLYLSCKKIYLMGEKWIDIETTKKLLLNVCDFLEKDKSGIADFVIKNGKEAILLSMYTDAFFLLNEKFRLKFFPISNLLNGGLLTPTIAISPYYESTYINFLFPEPLFRYFNIFPELNKPKYLFMVNLEKYVTPSDYYRSIPFYELHAKEIFKDVLRKIENTDISPIDCLVWVSTYNGTYGEDLWEYIAGVVLRKRGYFITKYSIGGLADIFAYYIPEYSEKLINSGLINGGIFLEELEMLPLFDNNTNNSNIEVKKRIELIEIEAESSDYRTTEYSEKSGVGQVLKYISHYTSAFVAGPFRKEIDIGEEEREKVGLISCDQDGGLVFCEPKGYLNPLDTKVRLVENLIKYVLLTNLEFKERYELLWGETRDLNDYLTSISSLEIDKIIKKIKEERKFWKI